MSNSYLRTSHEVQEHHQEHFHPIPQQQTHKQQQQQQQTPPPQKRRRSVHFSPSQNSIHYMRDVPPSSIMTDEERKSAWYTYEDMEEMRIGAKKLARRLMGEEALGMGNDDAILVMAKTQGMDGCDSISNGVQQQHHPQHLLRGLELFLSPTRQFNRLLTIQTVLESQRRNQATIEEALASGNVKNGERRRLWYEVAGMRLGCVSQRCSHVARDLALVTGLNDFQGVYGKDLYDEMVIMDPKRKERTDTRTRTLVPPQQQHLEREVPLGFSPRRRLSCGKKRMRMQQQEDVADFGCGEMIMMERCSKRRFLIKST